MLIFIHLIISSLLSSFLKEFGWWTLEIFSAHMVPAVQYVQLFIHSHVSTTLLAYKQRKLQYGGTIIPSFRVSLWLSKAWLILQRKRELPLQLIPLFQGIYSKGVTRQALQGSQKHSKNHQRNVTYQIVNNAKLEAT